MEWIGLILQIILLGAFLFWEGYNKKKGENQALKEDSRDINYEGEKGKNLATKEDIAHITQQIESVKDSYNKALESHKIELQKEFESHKYIMGLCHSLDKTLLIHISSCLKAETKKGIEDWDNDEALLMANNKLSSFLNTYKNRYDSIPVLHKLRDISGKIDSDYMLFKFMTTSPINGEVNEIPSERKQQFIDCLNESMAYFIPALVP
jgi:hypothetical protein